MIPRQRRGVVWRCFFSGTWHDAPVKCADPEVLEGRWRQYAAGRQWDACLEIATALTRLVPERRVGWMRRAISLNRLRRTTEAKEVLLEAVGTLGFDSVCAFHLACFCARLGQMEEAADWVRKAVELAQDQETFDRLRRWVLDEPDLQPVWEAVGGR